ncbi:hypothetical protein DFH11DRAFT_1086686 [Phellopilus nigrolimitatus]|nr:hypothetical protein DFH11DRAFT_1086686 [Phellopilus nigrolimitatus]
MNTSPAVTEADLRSDSYPAYVPNIIGMQAFNAFWRQDGDIYICLFESFFANFFNNYKASVMVRPYSFTPQTRTFEYKNIASLHLDGDEYRPRTVSSQSGRLAVSGFQGLYGSDMHRLFQDGPIDRSCRKVLPGGIDCYGMELYSGAILWMQKRSWSNNCNAFISFLDHTQGDRPTVIHFCFGLSACIMVDSDKQQNSFSVCAPSV